MKKKILLISVKKVKKNLSKIKKVNFLVVPSRAKKNRNK